jgi:hypothetical protein
LAAVGGCPAFGRGLCRTLAATPALPAVSFLLALFDEEIEVLWDW